MMDNKGLFGKLIFLCVLVVLIIVAIVYLTGNFKFRTGKVSVNIGYDSNKLDAGDIEIIEEPGEFIEPQQNINTPGEVNFSVNDSRQNNSLNYTNISG